METTDNAPDTEKDVDTLREGEPLPQPAAKFIPLSVALAIVNGWNELGELDATIAHELRNELNAGAVELNESKSIQWAVAIIERLVTHGGPEDVLEQASRFLKEHPIKGSYQESYNQTKAEEAQVDLNKHLRVMRSMSNLLRHSFRPIDYHYNSLTSGERNIVTEEEFKEVVEEIRLNERIAQ